MALTIQISLAFIPTITNISARRYVPRNMVTHMRDYAVKENWKDLAEQLNTLLENLQDLPEHSPAPQNITRKRLDSSGYERLDSGIYLIRQRSNSSAYSGELELDEKHASQDEHPMLLENADNTPGTAFESPFSRAVNIAPAESDMGDYIPLSLVHNMQELIQDEPHGKTVLNLSDAMGQIPEIMVDIETNLKKVPITSQPSLDAYRPNTAMSVYFKKSTDDEDQDISISMSNKSEYEMGTKSKISPEIQDEARIVPNKWESTEDTSFSKDSSPSHRSMESDSGIDRRWLSQESLSVSERSVDISSTPSRRDSSASGSSTEFHTTGKHLLPK